MLGKFFNTQTEDAGTADRLKEMVAVLTGMLPYIGFPKTLNALTAINKAYPEDEE